MSWDKYCSDTCESLKIAKLAIFGICEKTQACTLWGKFPEDFGFAPDYLQKAVKSIENHDYTQFQCNGVYEPNGNKYIYVRDVPAACGDAIVAKKSKDCGETRDHIVILDSRNFGAVAVFPSHGQQAGDDVAVLNQVVESCKKHAGL